MVSTSTESLHLTFDGLKCVFRTGDTVLDCLERNRVSIAASCYDGICGVCTVRSEGGVAAPRGQGSLRSAQRALGFVLACRCPAQPGLLLVPRDHRKPISGVVEQVCDRSPALEVRLRTARPTSARPGQNLLVRSETAGLLCYPILDRTEERRVQIAIPEADREALPALDWKAGQSLLVEDWQGECFYFGQAEEELILLGSGERGMLCLLASLRIAKRCGHRGRVRLYLEGCDVRRLAQFTPLWGDLLERFAIERLTSVPQPLPSRGATRVYICGPRDFVRRGKRQIFSAGGTLEKTHLQVI